MTGIPVVASGRVTLSPTGTNTYTSAVVTLPAGMFDTAPVVTVTARSGGTTAIESVAVDSETTTSFRVSMYRTTKVDAEMNWIAAGKGKQ